MSKKIESQMYTAAAHFGYTTPYFYAMKSSNIKKWKHLISFDKKSLVNATIKYKKYVEDLRKYLVELYYEIDNKTLKKILVDSKAYCKHDMTVKNFEKTIFRIDDDIMQLRYCVVEKWEKIKEHYEKNYKGPGDGKETFQT